MVDEQKTIAVLNRVPLFNGLKKRQLQRLAKRFTSRQYQENEPIVTQGKGGEGFFIITAGKTDVIRERLDGTKAVVNTLGPSDYFGELALLDDGLRTASVIATEPTTCLILTRWHFHGILKEDAEMAILMLEDMAKRFRRALDVL
jgi:CRP-like cAMP-binding protein